MIEMTAVGNLGRDPEEKLSRNGKSFAIASIAINKGYFDRDSNEWVEQDPVWVSLVCFDFNAEKLMKFSKGDTLIVKGEPSARGYENNDGDCVANLSCNVRYLRGFNRQNDGNSERSERRGNRRQNRRRQRNDDYEDGYENPL